MRFRLAVSALLAIGVLMSGGGAALALSGSSGQGQSAEVVYPPPKSATAVAVQGEAQAPRQAAAAAEREIPFTGFAAIPVVGIGVVLLVSGVLLRRRSATPPV